MLTRGDSLFFQGLHGVRHEEKLISTISKPTTEFVKPHLSSQTAVIPSERVQIWVCLFLLWNPIWLVLPTCEATNLGVFDLCHFALLKMGLCKFGCGFRARWSLAVLQGLNWAKSPIANR